MPIRDRSKDETYLARDVTVIGNHASAFGEAYLGTIVLKGRFAQSWFSDALKEARTGRTGDKNASRREIIFAACCAESFLYEWTYDLLTSIQATSAFESILEYFPVDSKRGLEDQWLEVPKQLAKNQVIAKGPDNSSGHWRKFVRLCTYRNGLVHAHLSRPTVAHEDNRRVYGVTPDEIETIEPGWATQVVAERIRTLNEAAGTEIPGWVVDL